MNALVDDTLYLRYRRHRRSKINTVSVQSSLRRLLSPGACMITDTNDERCDTYSGISGNRQVSSAYPLRSDTFLPPQQQQQQARQQQARQQQAQQQQLPQVDTENLLQLMEGIRYILEKVGVFESTARVSATSRA